MGYQANYLLRRGGRTQIFHSPWGAVSLAQDIFWGPEETTRFLRELEAADELLPPAACAAAALVDWDRHRLTWFESSHDERSPVERRLYARLLEQSWPDWEIRYAAGGILTIAAELGLDHAAVPGAEDELAGGPAAAEVGEEFAPRPAASEVPVVGDDVSACLASLVTRLLDEERWAPHVVLDDLHRASRGASLGCGCLLILVTLPAIAIAAWLRTTPVVVACALAVLAVLIPAVRVWRRSALVSAAAQGFKDVPLPAGPALPKKRSILDQALTRLGYPTTEQLEQAGLCKCGAAGAGAEDELPDRFGPLRPVRADEIAGVAFCRISLSELRLRELRRGTTLWRACLLKYLTPYGWYSEAIIPVPRAERLIPLHWRDLPNHVQRRMEPWRSQAAESGFAAEFIYTLPMLGRQEWFALALCDAAGWTVASLTYARARIRLSPDDDQYSDEEMFEVALSSVLPDNRLLVTQGYVAELDPPPDQDVQVHEDADWPALWAAHQQRIQPRVPDGLQRVEPADLPRLLLQWKLREVDYHLARGAYRRMTREDIDRFAEEG